MEIFQTWGAALQHMRAHGYEGKPNMGDSARKGAEIISAAGGTGLTAGTAPMNAEQRKLAVYKRTLEKVKELQESDPKYQRMARSMLWNV